MAVVYEAEHLRLGQRVAIKMVLPEIARHPEVMERLEREARAAAQLKSPHAARVTDVDVLPDGWE
jgi:serine/threonine-protein kinase